MIAKRLKAEHKFWRHLAEVFGNCGVTVVCLLALLTSYSNPYWADQHDQHHTRVFSDAELDGW
jgi:hypothetical protein